MQYAAITSVKHSTANVGPQIAPENGLAGWAGLAGLAGLAYRKGPISVAEASASFGCAPPAGGQAVAVAVGVLGVAVGGGGFGAARGGVALQSQPIKNCLY